jgi:N-acetylglucosaminyldiphosphoundecaprenol N-acetyl-beta-D-mannosaminyltransferase
MPDGTALPRRRAVELFGLPVDALTIDQTVEAVREMVSRGGAHQHVSLNAAKVLAARDDPRLAEIIRRCDLVSADGMSVVWAGRLLGARLPERVAGIDLFIRLVETAERDGRSVYFLGARSEVVEQVATVFGRRHPRLRIAGLHDGYWADDEQLVEDVRRAQADLLFLAIPSPRKEFWLFDRLDDLGVRFAMGVGGSFDVVAGITGRAPLIVQRLGLEWGWRLIQEPRRMWRRYLVGNLAFVGLTAREWWRRQ